MTVTCPFASRYEDRNAAQAGEQRKDREYPVHAGLAVSGVAVDVYGRHGPALESLLVRVADLARQHDQQMGVQPRWWLHRYRARISVEMVCGCARLISTSTSSSAPLHIVQAPQAGRAEGAAHAESAGVVQPAGCVPAPNSAL